MLSHLATLICMLGSSGAASFPFDCTTEWGPYSLAAEGSTSNATCSNNRSIVSCGIDDSEWDTDFLQRGVSHIGAVCQATNGAAGGTVRAVARCCTMPEGATCEGQNTGSVSGNGATISKTCGQEEYMTGCAVHSDGEAAAETQLDGAWPGDATFSFLNGSTFDRTNIGGYENVAVTPTGHENECTAVDGKDDAGSAIPALTCCVSPKAPLDCIFIYGAGREEGPIKPHGGDVTGSDGDVWSNVTCPSEYTMMGCSGYSDKAAANTFYIDDATKVCQVRTRYEPAYASAICCRYDTVSPTTDPTSAPSFAPSLAPSAAPSVAPSLAPSAAPSKAPSLAPSEAPSVAPTQPPSVAPSMAPLEAPTVAPTQPPSVAPSMAPTEAPSVAPSTAPSAAPSWSPTQPPSAAPSSSPTQPPTAAPSLAPSSAPSQAPSTAPSAAPSLAPSSAPSVAPTQPPSAAPSWSPTQPPSAAPSLAPSEAPSMAPSVAPSVAPSLAPSAVPTMAPTQPPSLAPSAAPSVAPSLTPTKSPLAGPTGAPTLAPTVAPSWSPTQPPSIAPSLAPSVAPSLAPSFAPSYVPTVAPTKDPTHSPTPKPTRKPTHRPTGHISPTSSPNTPRPTSAPTERPTLREPFDETLFFYPAGIFMGAGFISFILLGVQSWLDKRATEKRRRRREKKSMAGDGVVSIEMKRFMLNERERQQWLDELEEKKEEENPALDAWVEESKRSQRRWLLTGE